MTITDTMVATLRPASTTHALPREPAPTRTVLALAAESGLTEPFTVHGRWAIAYDWNDAPLSPAAPQPWCDLFVRVLEPDGTNDLADVADGGTIAHGEQEYDGNGTFRLRVAFACTDGGSRVSVRVLD